MIFGNERRRRRAEGGRVFLALLLASLCFSLMACQSPSTEYTPPNIPAQLAEEVGRQNVTAFLHYYDESGNEKVAPASFDRREGESRAMLAAQALFQNSEEAQWSNVPQDWQPLFVSSERNVQVANVALSGNTANVELQSVAGGSVDLSTRVKIRVYLANTLIDTFPELEYVNVFYNGKPIKYNNMALGAMGRYEGSPDEYLEELKQRSDQAYPMTINATLYFPHEDGEYLVCETRPIEMTDGLGRAVLAALMRGPSSPGLTSITSGGIMNVEDSFQILETLGPPREGESAPVNTPASQSQEEDENGETAAAENGENPEDSGDPIFLDGMTAQDYVDAPVEGGPFSNFEQMLNIRIQGTADNPALSQAAVVCTMLTLQDKDGVAVLLPQQSYGDENTYLTRQEYEDALGNWLSAYARTDGEFLLPVRGVGPQEDVATSLELPLSLLWKTADDVEEDMVLRPVFPGIWKENLLRSVTFSGNLAIVDLEEACLAHWQTLSADGLRLELYSIVNTLTDSYGINAVQILIEGDVVDQVGDLTLRSPMMANLGLLQL